MDKQQAIEHIKLRIREGKDRKDIIKELSVLLNAPENITSRFVDSVYQTIAAPFTSAGSEEESLPNGKNNTEKPGNLPDAPTSGDATEGKRNVKHGNKLLFRLFLIIGLIVLLFAAMQIIGMIAEAYGYTVNGLYLFGFHMKPTTSIILLFAGLIVSVTSIFGLTRKKS